MRVVVFGFQIWGTETLKALLEAGHVVPLVLTHPESSDPHEQLWPNDVRPLAAAHGIDVLVARSANDPDIKGRLRALEPDLLILSNWRTWIDPELAAIARHGALNLHDGLLPAYGGFAPLSWAIANGETEIGVTVHRVEPELDGGDILLQQRLALAPHETVADALHRTVPLFGSLAVEAVSLIGSAQAVFTAQDKSCSTFYHKRSSRECCIDWARPRHEVRNLIRAQSAPFPPAYGLLGADPLFILHAIDSVRDYRGTPGRILSGVPEGVVVLCGGPGAQGLVLHTVQTIAGPSISAAQFRFSGHRYFRAATSGAQSIG